MFDPRGGAEDGGVERVEPGGGGSLGRFVGRRSLGFVVFFAYL